jgi:hypothetical protein
LDLFTAVSLQILTAIGFPAASNKNADDRNRRPVLTSETTKRKTLYIQVNIDKVENNMQLVLIKFIIIPIEDG